MRGLLSPLIKLVVFIVVTAAFTYVLGATISNQAYGATETYSADFTDVTGMQEGDDVRIAGVRVGTVDAIQIIQGKKQVDGSHGVSTARVTFTVQKSRPLPKDVTVQSRYRNLVGQRYLDVEQGPGSSTSMLKPGSTIPLSQTKDAVDLTVLFTGFGKLVEGLDATQLNQLTLEVVQTLQGEGGALDLLLQNVATLTNRLADKDQVIGDVVDNLSQVLTTIGDRDTELSDLIIQLKNFVSGLAQDRTTIGNAIDGINGLATSTAGLLTQVRAPLAGDVKDLTAVTALLNRNKPTLNYVLAQLPPTIAGLIRTASYGSWFNFYLCSLSGTATLLGQKINLKLTKQASEPRCGP